MADICPFTLQGSTTAQNLAAAVARFSCPRELTSATPDPPSPTLVIRENSPPVDYRFYRECDDQSEKPGHITCRIGGSNSKLIGRMDKGKQDVRL